MANANASNESTQLTPIKKSRDELRASVFSTEFTTLQTIPYEYNGVALEFRQPTIAEMSSLQDDSGRNFIVRAMIQFSYIPDTNEKLFEDSDYDTICGMPLNSSFNVAVTKITELLNIKVDDKVKN